MSNIPKFGDPILRTPEARAYLGNMSNSRFWDLVKQGEIKTFKLGNKSTAVRLSELERFLSSKGA